MNDTGEGQEKNKKPKRSYIESADWLRHLGDPPDPGVPPGYVAPTIRVVKDYSKPVPEDQKPRPLKENPPTEKEKP
jgi:hypothetical protein